MKTSFFWFGVFSGSFGVRSIVLFRCSGKYIDIYFKLKITCSLHQQKAIKKGAKFFHEGTVCAWMAWAINNIDVDSLTMTRKGGPISSKEEAWKAAIPSLMFDIAKEYIKATPPPGAPVVVVLGT